MTITGSIFEQSGLAIIQDPHAYATIEGNTFDGVSTQGCYFDSNVNCGSMAASYQVLLLEGTSDWTVGVNHMANISSAVAGAFLAEGSNLTLPSMGTKIDLPVNRGHV